MVCGRGVGSRHRRWKSELSKVPLPPHSSYNVLTALRAACAVNAWSRRHFARSSRLTSLPLHNERWLLQRHRVHRVDLGDRLRVAGHLIVSRRRWR